MVVEPSLKQLRYFSALAAERHFGHAARACHVTQPALSEQVKLLEDQLGVQLIERTRRRVALTPAGEALLERARAILREVDDFSAAAGRLGEPFSLPLTLGVIPTVAPYLLPRLLPRLRRALPKLRLLLRENQTSALSDMLARGEIDLMLLALPIEHPDFDSAELFGEEFVLLAHSGSSLAGADRLKVSQLRGEELMLLEEGHCLRDQALEVCNVGGAQENKTFRASSLGTLVQMVAGGMGATLLPRMAVATEARGRGTLRVVEFAPPRPRRSIGLVWRRRSPRLAELRRVVELLAAMAPDLAA